MAWLVSSRARFVRNQSIPPPHPESRVTLKLEAKQPLHYENEHRCCLVPARVCSIPPVDDIRQSEDVSGNLDHPSLSIADITVAFS